MHKISTIYIIGIVIAVILGFGLALLTNLSILLSIIIAVVCGLASFITGIAILSKKEYKNCKPPEDLHVN